MPAVRDEVERATGALAINARTKAVTREGRGLTQRHDAANAILWLPLLAEHLAHPAVTAVARAVLDDHIRLCQFNTRPLPADGADGTPWAVDEEERHIGYPAMLSPELRGPNRREWHTCAAAQSCFLTRSERSSCTETGRTM